MSFETASIEKEGEKDVWRTQLEGRSLEIYSLPGSSVS